MTTAVIAVILAYLIGSLSFAVIVSRIMGLTDPRSYGSGNPGATNVLRSGRKAAAALTLLGDALKGWVAVWLALLLQTRFGWTDTVIALVAIAVFIGHLYPVFFRFKGGKGVATALGVLLAIQPLLGLLVLLSWVVVVGLSRMSSLGALVAAVLAPVIYVLGDGRWWTESKPLTYAIVVMTLLLLYRHHSNIRNLMSGTESKVR